ncbi:DUF6766 family protein [Catellatospora sichuanensis]|uniref:DUF6766 family protein n=1 Tax=Catellatospora sichuanensis TaxID=1969805 RepID=UPI001FE4D5D2|nr:DUF6766 family protein [Catellatospora sichuanensis]
MRNEELADYGVTADSYWHYLRTGHFAEAVFENWESEFLQSEFLAVGALIVLSIFLRQHGSPESKPVTAPHGQTGE